jgi:hypothetical protein
MSEQSAKSFSASKNEQHCLESRYSNQCSNRLSGLPIAIGARFRMSALGAARSPRLAEKQGIIVGGSRLNSSVRVLFDTYKSPISLHRDYIEHMGARRGRKTLPRPLRRQRMDRPQWRHLSRAAARSGSWSGSGPSRSAQGCLCRSACGRRPTTRHCPLQLSL